jgi:hypothetical protein
MTGGVFVRIAPRDSEAGEGRFEFRAWPRRQSRAATRLQGQWALESGESRADIYLATPFSPETLVKLRDGALLEVKHRGPDLGVLQFWTCPVSTPFPLSRRTLAVVARALGLAGGLQPEAGLSPAHLLVDLAASAPQVMPVTVRKARLVFRSGSCRAELCRATVRGRSRLTLALDDPDPASALCAVASLGLGGLPNRSYGDMLRPRRLMQAGGEA